MNLQVFTAPRASPLWCGFLFLLLGSCTRLWPTALRASTTLVWLLVPSPHAGSWFICSNYKDKMLFAWQQMGNIPPCKNRNIQIGCDSIGDNGGWIWFETKCLLFACTVFFFFCFFFLFFFFLVRQPSRTRICFITKNTLKELHAGPTLSGQLKLSEKVRNKDELRKSMQKKTAEGQVGLSHQCLKTQGP